MAVMVELPTTPPAVPPLGCTVVLVTTVPARPVAVPPVVGVPVGVYPLPAAYAWVGPASAPPEASASDASTVSARVPASDGRDPRPVRGTSHRVGTAPAAPTVTTVPDGAPCAGRRQSEFDISG